MSLKMQVVWDVLERAKDAADAAVIAACRRLIVADRRGWRLHADPKDWIMVKAFCED